MPERDLTFDNEVGLHARPAAVFVKKASEFDATITLQKGDAEADARSLLSVLKLDVRQGDTVHVTAEGSDADAALTALAELTTQL